MTVMVIYSYGTAFLWVVLILILVLAELVIIAEAATIPNTLASTTATNPAKGLSYLALVLTICPILFFLKWLYISHRLKHAEKQRSGSNGASGSSNQSMWYGSLSSEINLNSSATQTHFGNISLLGSKHGKSGFFVGLLGSPAWETRYSTIVNRVSGQFSLTRENSVSSRWSTSQARVGSRELHSNSNRSNRSVAGSARSPRIPDLEKQTQACLSLPSPVLTKGSLFTDGDPTIDALFARLPGSSSPLLTMPPNALYAPRFKIKAESGLDALRTSPTSVSVNELGGFSMTPASAILRNLRSYHSQTFSPTPTTDTKEDLAMGNLASSSALYGPQKASPTPLVGLPGAPSPAVGITAKKINKSSSKENIKFTPQESRKSPPLPNPHSAKLPTGLPPSTGSVRNDTPLKSCLKPPSPYLHSLEVFSTKPIRLHPKTSSRTGRTRHSPKLGPSPLRTTFVPSGSLKDTSNTSSNSNTSNISSDAYTSTSTSKDGDILLHQDTFWDAPDGILIQNDLLMHSPAVTAPPLTPTPTPTHRKRSRKTQSKKGTDADSLLDLVAELVEETSEWDPSLFVDENFKSLMAKSKPSQPRYKLQTQPKQEMTPRRQSWRSSRSRKSQRPFTILEDIPEVDVTEMMPSDMMSQGILHSFWSDDDNDRQHEIFIGIIR